MNLLLFNSTDLFNSKQLKVTARQHQHLHQTLGVNIGSLLSVGAINGKKGVGKVIRFNDTETVLEVELNQKPPAPLPLTLLLALPRPKMLKRVLQSLASLGAKDIHLINSYRVEKSFWQSPWVTPAAIHEQLLLGLEQAGDTVLPQVHLHKRFKPFVEDQLPAIIENTTALVAHPYTHKTCPAQHNKPTTLAIGPEGGFIDYEIEKLVAAGFEPVTLGERILRVETAVPVLLSRLFC